MSTILEFRNVGFAHGERSILENLSFTVQKGEMVALMGANGAGKTTLLRLAAGLLRPASGEIELEGQNVGQWERRQFARRVALVPQELNVPFAFRVEEIVAQGRVPHLGFLGGLTQKDFDAVERAMEAVDILRLRNRVFSELSGGEHQRVKIAIGLAQEPELMLLDEPTQHLDLGRQIELMTLLRRLVERGITIVSAIHDLGLAREHCSSGILLLTGHPAISGPLDEILRPEWLRRAFDVERNALESYLGADARTAAAPTRGNEAPEHHAQPHEQPRRRLRGRHKRGTNHWNHD
jgi:iron complex transport system ATP-binding protein